MGLLSNRLKRLAGKGVFGLVGKAIAEKDKAAAPANEAPATPNSANSKAREAAIDNFRKKRKRGLSLAGGIFTRGLF